MNSAPVSGDSGGGSAIRCAPWPSSTRRSSRLAAMRFSRLRC